jgi:hypothetical protein
MPPCSWCKLSRKQRVRITQVMNHTLRTLHLPPRRTVRLSLSHETLDSAINSGDRVPAIQAPSYQINKGGISWGLPHTSQASFSLCARLGKYHGQLPPRRATAAQVSYHCYLHTARDAPTAQTSTL